MTAQRTVPQLIADWADHSPDAIAVVLGNTTAESQRLTYGELWDAAGVIADRMVTTDSFRPGALLATQFPRGIQGVVCQLGIWRAGAAYLPVDGALPAARRAAILSDARPLGVLSPGGSGPADVSLDLLTDTASGDGQHGVGASADADVAYVIYTSGSTGTPKGIEVGHASLGNLVGWHRETYRTGPGVRVAAFAGLGFDASVWEVWSTLASGATLVLPDGVATVDIDAVCRFIDDQRVEQCFLSTPLAEQAFAVSSPPSSLKVLTTGGDRLRVGPPVDFPAAVFNHYGPTEATVVTTASGDLRKPAQHEVPVIGRPISGAEVRLLAEDGSTVTEPGESGELLIGGKILAIGYLRDEALNRKQFVRDPDGARWYASGDVCRWTADGELEFIGRRDSQVSLRGHRVELIEIEQAALRVSGVDQAAMVVRPDQDGGDLVGLYSGTAAADTVRAELADVLPAYMVPSTLLRLDAIPLNANGKINRAELLGLAQPGSAPAGKPVAVAPTAVDAMQEKLSGIWNEVLGRVPTDSDNFFEIGGHSLKAARVLNLTRKAFDIPLPLEVMFSSPVFADFTARVEEQLRTKGN
ncbi:non-ribosomal peptide synthetase [Streptomyces sp. NBC_00988]|uniref:non-ribosomal peptide synthetase n=1 Tax=Streptomyces sp. NBC_00988 TaxID=2903704 RepID=UPI00386405FF|nr:non-ribosomal peptide synthetase [Streptomyces sp. NBC_00988]